VLRIRNFAKITISQKTAYLSVKMPYVLDIGTVSVFHNTTTTTTTTTSCLQELNIGFPGVPNSPREADPVAAIRCSLSLLIFAGYSSLYTR
jgi:hypothetical protein